MRGQWKVYDVVVEGISFVDNYRGQFASILTNESFDSLLKRLRHKVDQRAEVLKSRAQAVIPSGKIEIWCASGSTG